MPGEATFPDAAQVIRIVRHRGDLDRQRTSTELVHAITSLPAEATDAATLARLTRLTRGHWTIEALPRPRCHLRRGCLPRTDRSRTDRAGRTAQTITSAIRFAGHPNIAGADAPQPSTSIPPSPGSPARQNRTQLRYDGALTHSGVRRANNLTYQGHRFFAPILRCALRQTGEPIGPPAS